MTNLQPKKVTSSSYLNDEMSEQEQIVVPPISKQHPKYNKMICSRHSTSYFAIPIKHFNLAPKKTKNDEFTVNKTFLCQKCIEQLKRENGPDDTIFAKIFKKEQFECKYLRPVVNRIHQSSPIQLKKNIEVLNLKEKLCIQEIQKSRLIMNKHFQKMKSIIKQIFQPLKQPIMPSMVQDFSKQKFTEELIQKIYKNAKTQQYYGALLGPKSELVVQGSLNIMKQSFQNMDKIIIEKFNQLQKKVKDNIKGLQKRDQQSQCCMSQQNFEEINIRKRKSSTDSNFSFQQKKWQNPTNLSFSKLNLQQKNVINKELSTYVKPSSVLENKATQKEKEKSKKIENITIQTQKLKQKERQRQKPKEKQAEKQRLRQREFKNIRQKQRQSERERERERSRNRINISRPDKKQEPSKKRNRSRSPSPNRPAIKSFVQMIGQQRSTFTKQVIVSYLIHRSDPKIAYLQVLRLPKPQFYRKYPDAYNLYSDNQLLKNKINRLNG